jgi:aminoglycoside phosphotransferase (APT) family kinase protein
LFNTYAEPVLLAKQIRALSVAIRGEQLRPSAAIYGSAALDPSTEPAPMPEHERLTTTQVADIVRAQFPHVQPSTVRYLGEGYDSTAFEVNGGWVFRFPKREDIEQQLLLEMRVLHVLERRSPPIPIPSFRLHGQPTAAFPRRFIGYPKLAGVPAFDVDVAGAAFRTWAPRLGQFLSWLHSFSPDEAASLGVQQRSITTFLDEFRDEALDAFDHVKTVAPNAPLEAWHAYLSEAPGLSGQATSEGVLVHGDFAAEHVLYDGTRAIPTGVIDWSEMTLCDRSVDLAGLFHWGGEPLVKAALAAYDGSVDELTLRRARFIAACRGATDIQFGLETGRDEYVRAGVRALTACIQHR